MPVSPRKPSGSDTHVRHSGSVSKYLESCFRNEFEAILKKLEIRDADVNRLLAERARV
jgi:hypothetical protein